MRSGSSELAAVVALVVVAGCASPRYVGSIGRDRTYSNRGFGLTVRLSDGGLLERWNPIDPTNTARAPSFARPLELTDPIDLDGDGLLDITERTRRQRPVLRLLNRAEPKAHLDLDVMILGGKQRKAPLDSIAAGKVRQLVGTSSSAFDRAINAMEKAKVGMQFPVVVVNVATSDGRTVQMAMIDQGDFMAEEGVTRRQIVQVMLSAPTLTPELAKDHRQFLDAVILNRRAARATLKEQW